MAQRFVFAVYKHLNRTKFKLIYCGQIDGWANGYLVLFTDALPPVGLDGFTNKGRITAGQFVHHVNSVITETSSAPRWKTTVSSLVQLSTFMRTQTLID